MAIWSTAVVLVNEKVGSRSLIPPVAPTSSLLKQYRCSWFALQGKSDCSPKGPDVLHN